MHHFVDGLCVYCGKEAGCLGDSCEISPPRQYSHGRMTMEIEIEQKSIERLKAEMDRFQDLVERLERCQRGE